MATVTQTIQNYTGGISQQPDEKKLPGQVVDAVNVLPDVTEGLQKRPGAEFVGSLSDHTTAALNSQTNGKWFHYYRDEAEQYIGQVSRSGDVNMWRCSDGATMHVEDATGLGTAISDYLTHTNDSDIQTLTLNDFTYFTNRTKPTGMSATIEASRPNEAYIELTKIAYSKQYSINIFNSTALTTVTTATRIKIDLVSSSNNYCDTNGAMVNRAARYSQVTKCDDDAGQNRDALSPNVATEIFSVGSASSYTDVGPSGTHTETVKVFNPANNVLTGDVTPALTYSRSNATISIAHDSHGYSNGDWLEITFSGAQASDGIYQISSVSTDAYTVTDHHYDSGSETGTANVTKGNLTGRSDLYFQITNIGQSTPYGAGSNVTYNTRYTTTHDLLYGGNGWQENDYFYVWMKDGYYRVTVDEISTARIQANLGLVRPQPTPFDTETTITAESVLGDIQQAIVNAAGSPFALADVQIIGNGIYLTDANNFNVTAPGGELMNIVTSEVNDIEDLPQQCKHGYIVLVRNSEAQEDDYYLRFKGENNRDGRGAWEECPQPGRRVQFDKNKMPIQMSRQLPTTADSSGNTHTNGWFKLEQIEWEKCLVGDNVTVPKPSFISTVAGVDDDTKTVNRYINKMLFFRNRLVILSDEDVIMSQPGEFFNFWPKSAIQYTATDAIDVSCSSEYPAIVYDGIQINAGLLLFTKNQQFMLTTDSDVLSPQTAKINSLASYNFNSKSNPISLGTTVGFLDNAGKYSRFWEMANALREGEPVVVDQTKVVSKLFDGELDKISNSRENGLVFFTTKNSQELYGLSYFVSGEKRVQQAWFKWTFNGTIQHHCVLDDEIYLIIRNNSKDTMQRITIKTDATTDTITDDRDTTETTDDLIHRIHLDNMAVINIGSNRYDSTTDKTIFARPQGYENTAEQLVIYDNSAGSGVSDPIGQYAEVTTNGGTSPKFTIPTSAVTIAAETITITGHGYSTGNPVIYSNGSGTTLAGLTHDTTYYVIKVDANTIKLATTASNAVGGTAINLTGTGNNAQTISSTLEVPRDWSGNSVVLGYLYEMNVTLPTIYYTQTADQQVRADTRSSLVVHRVKLNFGAVGMYTTLLERLGKDPYSQTWEPPLADSYRGNAIPINNTITHTIPTYEKNQNLSLTLTSKHPAPATLISMSWEGDLNNKHYRSV